MIDLIEQFAIKKKEIYIVAYTEKYCEPSDFDERLSFINSTESEQIIKYIVEYVKLHSKYNEFEFDNEFCGDEAQFKIDGYKTIKIKNCNPELKINFEDIEKTLYDELIKNKLKTNYNPFKS